MKIKIVLLAALLVFVLSACSDRRQLDAVPDPDAEIINSTPEEFPVPADPNPPKEQPKEEEPADSDPTGITHESGLFAILGTGFEVNLPEPWSCGQYEMPPSMDIIYNGDTSVKGSITYIEGDENVRLLESDIENMDVALQADKDVFGVNITQGMVGKLYNITITYSTAKSETSQSGFTYVRYQRTDEGIIVAMFYCPRADYNRAIQDIFDSIKVGTVDAKVPPTIL